MWHKLDEKDYQKRVDFAQWFLKQPSDTLSYIICSDEAYFCLTQSIY